MYLKQVLTVEPIVFIFILAHFNRIVVEPMIKRNVPYDFAIDSPLDDTRYYSFLQYFCIPGIIILFTGSYSDCHGLRKPFLLLPICGEFIAIVGLFVCVKSETQCPTYIVYSILKLIAPCFGGLPMLWMASCAYVADISDTKTRTFRLGILDVVPFVADLIFSYCGIFGGSSMKINFTSWVSINSTLLILAILYGCFWIEEPKQGERISVRSVLDFFSPRHILNTGNMVLAKRPNRERSVILILFCLIFAYNFTFNSNGHFINRCYLEITEYLKYDVLKENISGILLIGTAVSAVTLCRLLKIEDMIVLLINLTCLIVSNIIFGLANNLPVLYLALSIESASLLIPTVSKSILTKTVSKEDYGKMSTCFTLFYTLAIPLVNKFEFVNRIKKYSAYFYFGAFFHFVFVILILWIHLKNKKDSRREETSNRLVDDEFAYEILPTSS